MLNSVHVDDWSAELAIIASNEFHNHFVENTADGNESITLIPVFMGSFVATNVFVSITSIVFGISHNKHSYVILFTQ